jgi:hypothetical protein
MIQVDEVSIHFETLLTGVTQGNLEHVRLSVFCLIICKPQDIEKHFYFLKLCLIYTSLQIFIRNTFFHTSKYLESYTRIIF